MSPVIPSPDMVAAAAEAQARGYSVPYNVYSGPGGSTLVGVVNPDCTLGQTFPDRPEASNPIGRLHVRMARSAGSPRKRRMQFRAAAHRGLEHLHGAMGAAQAIQQNQANYQAVVETSQQQAAVASPGVQPSQYIPAGQPGSYSATQIAAENAQRQQQRQPLQPARRPPVRLPLRSQAAARVARHQQQHRQPVAVSRTPSAASKPPMC